MNGDDTARQPRKRGPLKPSASNFCHENSRRPETARSIRRDSDRAPHRPRRDGRSAECSETNRLRKGGRARAHSHAKIQDKEICRPAATPGAPRRARSRCAARCGCRRRSYSSRNYSSGNGKSSALASTNSSCPVKTPLGGAPPALLKHSGIDVEHHDLGRGRARFGDPEGDVAGAAGHIKVPELRSFGRLDPGRENILPDPMETGRHQIVHNVVTRSDLVKDLIHTRLLVAQWHAGKTEMRLFCHVNDARAGPRVGA